MTGRRKPEQPKVDELAAAYARLYSTPDGEAVLDHICEALAMPVYRAGGQAHDAVGDVRCNHMAMAIASMVRNGRNRAPVTARPKMHPIGD